MDWVSLPREVRDVLGFELFAIGGTQVTTATLIVALLVVLAALGLSRLAQTSIRKTLSIRGVTDPGSVAVTARLVHYALLFTGIGVALHTLGLNVSTLLTASAVFAVGLGFATQNLSQNFVSGIVLLIERIITPGDVLEVDGQVVRVERMTIRSTIVRTRDGEDVIVPNSSLLTSSVKNFTLADSAYRVRSFVGVEYRSDMKQVRAVLEEVARAQDGGLPDFEPQVLMVEFASSAVVFEVAVWMADPWRARKKLSQLNEAIWWALADARIHIAFPQLDVHFDRTEPPQPAEPQAIFPP